MPLRGARTTLAVQRQLVDLAAEADHQHAAEIHMSCVAGERPVQHVHAVAGRAHATALVVHDRHETVDALVMRQDRPVRLVGDCPADRGGTVHAGNDADIVACRRPPVGAAIAHEGARLVIGGRRFRRRIGGRRQPVVFEMQVVAVHMVAGLDLGRRAADRLSVFHHGRAERNIRYRHLVAGVDLLAGLNAGNRRTRRDCRRCDRDIVTGRKDDPRQFVQFILPGKGSLHRRKRIDFVFYLQ